MNNNTTIQELEKQLQEAKQKEAWEELSKECKKMCDLYKGKAYGSCALRYNNINKYFHDHLCISIQYFQDIYISGPNPDKIKISTFDDYKKFSPYVGIRYETEEITIFKNSTTIDIHSAKYDLKKPDTGLKYTIDLKVYQNLKNIMSSKIDSIFQESLHHINFSDIGTYLNEEILKKQGCRLIELSNEELYLLTSENHPFIYGKNLLVIDISIDILKNMLKDFQKGDAMDKDMYICGEHIRRSGFYEGKIETIKTLLGRI